MTTDRLYDAQLLEFGGDYMLIGWKAAGADRSIASLRYRVEAPLNALLARGHDVEIFDPAKAKSYGAAVFAKAYSPADRALAAEVKASGGRVIFDLCDNHFYNPYDLPKYRRARENILDMLTIADGIVCATPALAAVVRQEAPWAPTPIVIGDAAEVLAPAESSLPPFEGARLLWFGSHGSPNAPSGMVDILLVAERLIRVNREHPIELVVCSNDKAKFHKHIAPLPFATRYVEWTLEGFPGVLHSADAVIIPVSSNPFTECKTHNRLTTALRAGVPVIADPIESYREFSPFCALNNWDENLRLAVQSPEILRARAAQAKAYIDKNWTAAALAPAWEEALGLTAPVGASAPQAASAPEQAILSSAAMCQGGLDRTIKEVLTGWVRMPGASGPLHVLLERDGETIGRVAADLHRGDLARAGMPYSDCGFAISWPEAPPLSSSFRLVVEETGWTFGLEGFQLRPLLRGGYSIVPAGTDVSRAAVQRSVSTAPLPDASALRSAREVQDHLLAELESLNALVIEARDVAARLVVASGDDVALALRLLTRVREKARAIHDQDAPEPFLDAAETRLN